ncbi:MAG: amidohydrolase family protein [Cyclobacteriaceae bacterium]|nr:amidohydrolase family protein [Cyclobacteriaceae bacterium]
MNILKETTLVLASLLLLSTNFLFAQTTKSYYLTADRIFDGEITHTGWAVVVEVDKIISIGPKEKIKEPISSIKISYPNSTLLPGLIEGHSHLLLYPYNVTDWDTQVLKETDAYRTAHSSGARALHLDHQVGAIKEELKADLVVVTGDPSMTISDVKKLSL